LPEKIYETEMLDLTDEQKAKYKELKNEFITEFNGEVVTAAVVLTRLIRFSQITSGFLKAGATGEERELPFPKNPKIEWLKEFLEDRLPSDSKVIVFCRFIHDIKAIQKLCKELNIGYATIYGAVENRQEMVDNFNNNPKVRVFIGQIQTSGMGINLTAASYVIYYSNSYS
jgi:SNF2 family DNA or RNA helicase